MPVHSRADVEQLELPGRFDLIWVGSLFTHLDPDRWDEATHESIDAFRTRRGITVTDPPRIAVHGGVGDRGVTEPDRVVESDWRPARCTVTSSASWTPV